MSMMQGFVLVIQIHMSKPILLHALTRPLIFLHRAMFHIDVNWLAPPIQLVLRVVFKLSQWLINHSAN